MILDHEFKKELKHAYYEYKDEMDRIDVDVVFCYGVLMKMAAKLKNKAKEAKSYFELHGIHVLKKNEDGVYEDGLERKDN